MSAPEYVTEIAARPADGRYGWRLCSGMREPEPLPEPEPEPEPGR